MFPPTYQNLSLCSKAYRANSPEVIAIILLALFWVSMCRWVIWCSALSTRLPVLLPKWFAWQRVAGCDVVQGVDMVTRRSKIGPNVVKVVMHIIW